MSHAQIGCREGIDSRLLVVGSQTASLTPGPSFAHNSGCRCPNCQCEGIFDIYVSRPFQRHKEHPNARCFAPFCRALNIRESRRTPNPQLFQVLGFTPTLGQSGVATAWPTPGDSTVSGRCPRKASRSTTEDSGTKPRSPGSTNSWCLRASKKGEAEWSPRLPSGSSWTTRR